MPDRSNGNNVYKPKMTGFLIAAIALVLLVAALLTSTILILSFGSQKNDQTDAPKTEATTPGADPAATTPAATDDPAQTTPDTPDNPDTPDTPNTPDTPTVPTNPNRIPTKVSPDEVTVSFPESAVYEGSLLLIDEEHTYRKDADLLISRSAMGKLSAAALKDTYNFSRITGASGNYSLAGSNFFINSDALYYFDEMLADYVSESGNKDVQIRNAYYCTGDQSDIESVEHSTGYFLDLQIYRSNGTYPLNFESLKADYYNWFIKNCWKYGFIHVRNIENKYSTFRFVGPAHAAAMNKYSFNLTQYLSALSVYNAENPMKVTDGFGWEWWVFYVPVSGSEFTAIDLIGNKDSYRVSGSNTDGFIAAINTSCFS